MKIIAPPTDEPITLDIARKQCRIDPDGSPPTHEDDDLVTIYMSTAREWCEAYTGLALAPTTVQIALDAFPSGTLTLESGPVLGNITVNYLDTDGVEQTFGDSFYMLDTNAQIPVLRLLPDQAWPATQNVAGAVVVQYDIGFSTDSDSPISNPIPNSIKAAILLLTSHLYKNRDSTTEQALIETPMGVIHFLQPYIVRRRFA